MDYEKLIEETFQGNSDIADYTRVIMNSQKEILDLIIEERLFSQIYWDGIYNGFNGSVEEDDEDSVIVSYPVDEDQNMRRASINPALYSISVQYEKIGFMEKMIDEKRSFSDAKNIWNGFISSKEYDPLADFNGECFNNAIPYLNLHFKKLDNYIEKWDMYKNMFEKIENKEKSNQESILENKKPVKKSLIDRLFGK